MNTGYLRKAVVLFLVAAIFFGVFVSCSQSGHDSPSESGGDGGRAQVSDGLPEKFDTDGFEIRFLTREGMEEEITLNDPDESQDVVAAAVYGRQKNIEERFSCRISKIVEPQNPAGFKNHIRTSSFKLR